jgi:hypothetical protein
MHVLVKTILEAVGQGSCDSCYYVRDLFKLHVSVETGMDSTKSLCLSCLGSAQDVNVEQADMRPGREPPSRKTKKLSQRQERELAHRTGGNAQKGSGAMIGYKGDVRKKGVVRVECKLTRARSFCVTRVVLDKIRSEAVDREIPSLHIQFVSRLGKVEDEWVAVPVQDWEEKIANSKG